LSWYWHFVDVVWLFQTVTLLLKPAVVTLHLLGGMATLAVETVKRATAIPFSPRREAPRFHSC